jgi:hypothetical protein
MAIVERFAKGIPKTRSISKPLIEPLRFLLDWITQFNPETNLVSRVTLLALALLPCEATETLFSLLSSG